MTTTELRLDGCNKRIDKLIAKIEKLNGLIIKKQAKIASGKEEGNKYPNGQYWLEGDIETHTEDIQRAEKDLIYEQKKLVEYRIKKQAEIDKANAMPMVQSVEDFLIIWKNEADKYYKEQVKELKVWTKANVDLNYYDRIEYIKQHWDGRIYELSQHSNSDMNKKLEKLLSLELNRKREDLYYRCSEAVGVITDASGLYVGDNASLNGFIIGENGKAEVTTISAGGYIQCYHYRVLIKKVKEELK